MCSLRIDRCRRLSQKNWYFQIVLKNTLEGPLHFKEIKPVNPTGNQSWIFIGRSEAETEAPMLCPPDVKSWLIRKNPDARKTEGKRKMRWQRMKWLNSINASMHMNLRKLWEIAEDKGAWCATFHVIPKSQTGLRHWKTTTRGHIEALFTTTRTLIQPKCPSRN